jgi:hypothetical protein
MWPFTPNPKNDQYIYVFDLAIVGGTFCIGYKQKNLNWNSTLSLTTVYFVTEFLNNYIVLVEILIEILIIASFHSDIYIFE